jgi:PAS domain S-box-containing protein
MTSFAIARTEISNEALQRLLANIVIHAHNAVLVTAAEPVAYPGPAIVYVNHAFMAMSGYSFEEVVGQSPRMFQGPLTGTEVPAQIRKALDAWQPIVAEVLNYRKNGSTFWIELSIWPLADEKGQYTHWISVQRDISARKRQKDALRRSKSFLARASALSGVGSWELEIATGAITWSAETSRIHGLPPGEVPSVEDAINFFAEEARPAARASIQKCIEDGEPFSDELPFIRADGTRIWVRRVGEAVSENGKRAWLVGALQDVTAEVNERAARARSEAEFRASFEVSLFGKLLAEPKTRRIIRANQAFADMLGYQPNDLFGRVLTDFIWPADREDDAAHYQHVLRGDVSADLQEKRFVRRNGAPFWVLVAATVAWPAGSAVPSVAVISVQDIDSRVNHNANMQIAKFELEQIVAERTGALAQRDLLLQEVYHRVKNNLQVVDTLLILQSRSLADSRLKAALQDLRGRIHALGLVHEQLMESPDLKTFDIVPFLERLSKNILDGGGKDGVSIEVNTCSLQIGLDFAVPLGLLVTELVTNALKHADFPDQNGRILVGLSDEIEGELCLVVSDNGLTKRAAAAGAAAAGAAPAGGGAAGNGAKAGMGTSIIRSLVRQLEGNINVKTDAGTTTEIRMPMPVPP